MFEKASCELKTGLLCEGAKRSQTKRFYEYETIILKEVTFFIIALKFLLIIAPSVLNDIDVWNLGRGTETKTHTKERRDCPLILLTPTNTPTNTPTDTDTNTDTNTDTDTARAGLTFESWTRTTDSWRGAAAAGLQWNRQETTSKDWRGFHCLDRIREPPPRIEAVFTV